MASQGVSARASVETRAQALSGEGVGRCKHYSGAVNQVIVIIFTSIVSANQNGRKGNTHFCWDHDIQKVDILRRIKSLTI